MVAPEVSKTLALIADGRISAAEGDRILNDEHVTIFYE